MKTRTKTFKSGKNVTDPAEVKSRLKSLSADIAGVPDDDLQEREAALLGRALPPIDENDPAWQACVREKVRAALDDPRPSIPHEQVKHRIRERHAARMPTPRPSRKREGRSYSSPIRSAAMKAS
jgi:hypothetical protein